jgi:hypothetical protein
MGTLRSGGRRRALSGLGQTATTPGSREAPIASYDFGESASNK